MQGARIATLPAQHGAGSCFSQQRSTCRRTLLAARKLPHRQQFPVRRLAVRAEGGQQQEQEQGSTSPFAKGNGGAESPFQWAKITQALKKTVVPQVYDPEKEEFEVDTLLGLRAMIDEEDENARPYVEYLVKWKDGSPSTWERPTAISEDVLRDFENRWWTAAREADLGTLKEMLRGGKKLLANTLDENMRCALHFTAARGSADCVNLLMEYGADVNVADKEGYTPLHMAAGYLHTSTVIALLEGGADSEQEDRQGRDPMGLIMSLRANTPANIPQLLPRRAGLEAVARVMVDSLYEDVEPEAILAERPAEKGIGREFLVCWSDEDAEHGYGEDTWLPEKDLAEDIVADWDAGLEWADAADILDKRRQDGALEYLVRWADGSEDTWEPEQNVEETLIRKFEDEWDRAREERRAARAAAESEVQQAPSSESNGAALQGMQR